jgi:MFS-type transporter involved in bile tolerance (Atg22 family)
VDLRVTPPAIFPIYFKSITKGESVDFLWFNSIENDAFIGYISSFTFLILAIISPLLSRWWLFFYHWSKQLLNTLGWKKQCSFCFCGYDL